MAKNRSKRAKNSVFRAERVFSIDGSSLRVDLYPCAPTAITQTGIVLHLLTSVHCPRKLQRTSQPFSHVALS